MKGEKKNEWKKISKKYKKNIECCANFKEEIIILRQMNVLPFSKPTLQANNKSYLIPFYVFSHQWILT